MPTHHLLNGYTLWSLRGELEDAVASLPSLKDEGVTVLELGTHDLNEGLRAAVRDLGFAVVLQVYPNSVEEFNIDLERARDWGAIAVNAHCGHSRMELGAVAELVTGMMELARECNIPLVFETHRGRLTQDLFRTAKLCEAVPDIRFNLDVSHYVVCEERFGPVPELKPWFDPILDRVEMMHGRVCNGQQIQVAPGFGDGSLLVVYKNFWTEAMRRWRLRNNPGSHLIFTPEYGAPDYALTGPDGKEWGSRRQYMAELRECAQECWKRSATTGESYY